MQKDNATRFGLLISLIPPKTRQILPKNSHSIDHKYFPVQSFERVGSSFYIQRIYCNNVLDNAHSTHSICSTLQLIFQQLDIVYIQNAKFVIFYGFKLYTLSNKPSKHSPCSLKYWSGVIFRSNILWAKVYTMQFP